MQPLLSDPVTGMSIMVSELDTPDIMITAEMIMGAGNIGVSARYEDSDNYLLAYVNIANCVLLQRLAGANTFPISAAIAYADTLPIRLVLDGTDARLYYNNLLVGSASVSDAITGTKHGLFSGGVLNGTANNLTIYPRGTGNEYAILESM
jgi:hypothetical protein